MTTRICRFPLVRSRGIASLGAGVAGLAMAAGAALAMPVETPSDIRQVPGATADGRLDIREVLDNATAMEVRLTKQLMLLQRQINQLQMEIADLRAEGAATTGTK